MLCLLDDGQKVFRIFYKHDRFSPNLTDGMSEFSQVPHHCRGQHQSEAAAGTKEMEPGVSRRAEAPGRVSTPAGASASMG